MKHRSASFRPHRRDALHSVAAGVAAAAAVAAPSLPRPARAQEFPLAGRPIRIVVPFPPGGQTDLQARQAAPLLGELLGASVVVENRPGGNAVIAAQDVQRAAPDGHSLLYANAGMFTRNPFLFANLAYDPLKDFVPITQYVQARNILTANLQVPGDTLAQLVARARGSGVPLKYGIAGLGSNSHVLMELLRMQTGLELTMVPYKGTADAARDLQEGVIDLYVDGTQTALASARAGRVKMLGITGASRLDVAPELPTFVEQGFERMNIIGWIGFFGPAGLPAATTARLHGALVKVLERPDVATAIRTGGNEPVGSTPDGLRKVLTDEHAAMQALFAKLNLPKQ